MIFSLCLIFLVMFLYAEFQTPEISYFSIFPNVLCAKHFTVVLQVSCFVLVLAKACFFNYKFTDFIIK